MRMTCAGTGFRTLPLFAAIRAEGDPLAIRRPGGPEIAVHRRVRFGLAVAGEIAGLAGLEVHHPYIGGARTTLGRDIRQLRSIRRQHPGVLHRSVLGEALLSGAVRMHAPDVRLSVA